MRKAEDNKATEIISIFNVPFMAGVLLYVDNRQEEPSCPSQALLSSTKQYYSDSYTFKQLPVESGGKPRL